MNGLLRLKKLMTAAVFLVACFAVFGTANAAPLSIMTASWNDFGSTWAQADVQVSESSLVLNDGTSGKIVSIAYLSNGGETEGEWACAYQIIFESEQGSVVAVALGPVLYPVSSEAFNLFIKLHEDDEKIVANGVASTSSACGTNLFWLFPIFSPFLLINALDAGTNSFRGLNPPPAPLAVTPEPSVLPLLTVGFLGIARLRRRQRRNAVVDA